MNWFAVGVVTLFFGASVQAGINGDWREMSFSFLVGSVNAIVYFWK